MEVEGFTKQQIFDTLYTIVNDQKAETTTAFADQQRMMQEQHRAMLDALKEIREDIGDIQLRMERGISQPSSSTIKAASPPPTPRGGDLSQIGPSEDKYARGKAHDTAGVYVPPPARDVLEVSAILVSQQPQQFSCTVVELLLLHDSSDSPIQLPVEVVQIIKQFQSVFEEPVGLPPRRLCDHSIPLIPGAQPVNRKPYRYTPQLKTEIEKQIAEMLASGVIRISTSAFSSPIILVRKKDGSWRIVVDYRHLNALTIKSRYPVPVIDELLDELAGASWFSKLDLRAGYHQIRMAPGEEYKTSFQTHHGQFEFTVMAFGLTGAPATFLSAMNDTLSDYLRKFVLVFFDDILIYSTSYTEHLHHITLVLQRLQDHHWQVKMSKCEFAQQSIAYLGHIISAAGVATDQSKIDTVRDWPVPTNVKELRSFLGLSGYYRKFVKNYGIISKTLTNLLRKGVPYVWTTETDTAFQSLKQALISAPVLALPDFSKPFVVETDASDIGIGAVLLQDKHPIAFVSRALGPRTRGLSTYEKEYLAILLAVDQWRPYLQSGEFHIVTDQRSLAHLNDQHLHTQWQHKALTKMLGLQYTIVYRKGSENTAADALSRRPQETNGQLAAISSVVPTWLTEIITGYQTDPKAQALLAQLAVHPSGVDDYSLSDGIIRKKGKIWLGCNSELHFRVTEAMHASPTGGHSGFPVTYRHACAVTDLKEWLDDRTIIQDLLRQQLIRVQNKMKASADKKRSFREFQVDDLVPFKVLQRRMIRKGASTVSQVLVHWSGMDESLATWEDAEALRQHFPAAPAWGQAASQEGGIVNDPSAGPTTDDPATLRRSTRARQVPARLRD
ncbi:hypothetical protein QYE76_032079 [Lolium multiflorum]|uniref:Reverse transcriptase domain-containing protein n=1 Tax=Lolium multiflorum TaxID=4521 RepID=A0AAD8VK97_LOLMU|nr:hypothetical protein QYE76_032079 [Lolium multiflorum]